ncbi:PSD1 and planctomycete cytochrome C domain-containing protein [Bremerella sp. P1]|uniref:PSD1 and planctomycete cytochrome C domain-containing protein n=1 Tax=Bremerella sp. P1 TaxID=3026424 RepID=UPI002367FA76|nr:PSD1 and planctomycete cytochrome C domain-containing protein [Bremerella sp. P1]WDI41010.1 PSD1 and planctomycete cytochrome C domain-containing protein [Bremerella sp. P1]
MRSLFLFALATFAVFLPLGGLAADELSDAESLQFFEKKIRPVLVQECYSCHSAEADEIEGGLVLDTRSGSRRGGDRGPAVVPESLKESLLIEAIRHANDDLQMPPQKKLSPEVIADFEKWITLGAFDPREGESVEVHRYGIDIEEGRKHWAFQPPQDQAIPDVNRGDWPKTEIDRFVLAQLESHGISPVDDADKRTLLRRLSFDLTGLPPTEKEVTAFVTDDSPAAYEAVVDRLLASPHFGEKWARHWLDVSRYAESTGSTVNFFYPHAWRYRDYVIDAFNDDKPYDQYVKEQLAGDLMPYENPQQRAEHMIATGFLALGTKTLNERSGLKHELDVADEQIDVTTQAFLGVTAACARCHDHKFDPIPQADYYALAGIFRSTETCYGTIRYINAQRPSRLLTLPDDADFDVAVSDLSDRERTRIEDQIQQIQEQIRDLRDPVQRFLTSGRISLLQAQLDLYESSGEPKMLAMGVRDKRSGPQFRSGRPFAFGQGANRFSYDGTQVISDSPVYSRGEYDSPEKGSIPRGTLQVLCSTPLEISRRNSGRLELAEWIVARDNPLTARVMVNRIWLQLFGRGLVPTADDFGHAGQAPSNPELLDHLAISFMNDGWSVKRLIRRIITSRVYQLSSTREDQAFRMDPDNILLWRMSPRRLDAESLRDAMLAVSGRLEAKPPIGSAVATQSDGPVDRFGFVPISRSIDDPDNVHRSIYLPVIRDNLPESLALFDAADPSLITAHRQQTTVPSQGLYLLNNDFVLRDSDAAAQQLLKISDEKKRIEAAFVQFFGREATAQERDQAKVFLASYKADTPVRIRFNRQNPDQARWSAFCQALFASAEFQYRR